MAQVSRSTGRGHKSCACWVPVGIFKLLNWRKSCVVEMSVGRLVRVKD